MAIRIAVRRMGYRVAHRLLRLYWLFFRPPQNGVKCILVDGQKVLLVRHTYGRPGWDFPGGSARRGEEPDHAARREIQEELGLRVLDWTKIAELHVREHHRHDTLYCFQAEVNAPVLNLDLGELKCADWFPYDELPNDRRAFVDQIFALRL